MTTGEIVAYIVAFATSSYGFITTILNWREQQRKAKKTDAVLDGEAAVLESEAQTNMAEASNKLADASNKLADSTGKIADVSQRLIDQLSVALTKAEDARRSTENDLAILRKASADELKKLRGDYENLAREFVSFRRQCEADKLRYEQAIGHLQMTVDRLNKNTPE